MAEYGQFQSVCTCCFYIYFVIVLLLYSCISLGSLECNLKKQKVSQCFFCRPSMKFPVGSASGNTRPVVRLMLQFKAKCALQIQIGLTLLRHSSHTSGHRQEGAAHLEFAGEEESERRPPLLMSCTSAAAAAPTTTTTH